MSKMPKADSTDSTLSAVEEALKIDFKGSSKRAGGELPAKPPEGAAKKVKRMMGGAGAPTTRPSPAPEESGEPHQERNRPPADRKGQDRSRARRAANDDVRSVGNLLYALQRRPSSTPYWTALLLTLVWFGLGAAFGLSVWGDDIGNLGGVEDVRSSPQLLGLALAIIGPIVLFWAIAVLIWRSQEMRMVSRTMTEVALRLAEP